MDPLTAIGLASNILSFIDFGVKVVSGAIEIYESPSGDSSGNRNTKTVVTEMRHFASKLQPPVDSQLTGDEKALCTLARECDDLAKQIIALVEKAKPRGRKSKSASLLAAVRTKWYESDSRKLEERLDHCRDQLGLQLNHLTSSEVKSQLDELITAARDDTSKLQRLSSQVDHLRRGVEILSLSPVAQDQLRSLLGISEHAGDLVAKQRILAGLGFEGMYRRYEAVSDAHSKTLRWIFDDDSDSDLSDTSDDDSDSIASSEGRGEVETGAGPIGTLDGADKADGPMLSPVAEIDKPKAAAKEALHAWLSSGNGIFHISGKLGSGKSTLMKFLCEHESTLALLDQWAHPRRLVFASFFFWKPGSVLQSSLTGLFRSLLHDVLQASPGIIPKVLPNYWQQGKSMPWQVMNNIHFSDKDIARAFSRLISDASLYKDHCFCFFIDGLDEYEGTIQDDSKSLVDLLCNWTTIAPNNVKLCVSSREYNVFMNAFSANKRIRLHELTRRDMIQYVSGMLGPMDDEKVKSGLTYDIVNNAHGIFLWVAVVVKRMREQIENGRSPDNLRLEINALPKEMEGLFTVLLDSMPESDLREAYQVFSMVAKLSKIRYPCLPLLAYSFLDDYNQNPSFALEQSFAHAQLEPGELVARKESALKRLGGCCRGFIEVVQPIQNSRRGGMSSGVGQDINFTHRSFFEFLSTDARKDHMTRLLSGFNAVDAISHLVFADLLANPQLAALASSNRLYLGLVPLRYREKLDSAPYLFLEAFSVALSSRILMQRPPMSWMSPFDQAAVEVYCRPNTFLQVHCHERNQMDASATNQHQHLIYQAAFIGNHDYVRWKLTHDPTAFSQLSMEIVLTCIWKSLSKIDTADALDTVGLLINLGLTPQRPTNIMFAGAQTPIDRQDLGTQLNMDMTVWQHLLLECYVSNAWRSRAKLPILGYIVEKFLEHGANPHFQFVAERPDGKTWVFRLTVGRERQELLVRFGPARLIPYACEAASLTEFIKMVGFENEDRILQLVERNTKIFDGAAESDQGLAALTDVGSLDPASGDVEKPADTEPQGKGLSAGTMAEEKRFSTLLSSITNVKTQICLLIFGVMLALIVRSELWQLAKGRL